MTVHKSFNLKKSMKSSNQQLNKITIYDFIHFSESIIKRRILSLFLHKIHSVNRFKYLILFVFLLNCTISSAQIDSLNVSFRAAQDIQTSNEILKKIIAYCKQDDGCLKLVYEYLASPPATEIKAKAYLTLSVFSYRARELVKAKNQVLHGKEIAVKLKLNGDAIAQFNNQLSNVYRDLNDQDSAIIYADKAEKVWINDKEKVWSAYYNKYLAYLSLKDYKNADIYLIKSYEDLKNSENRMNKGFVLHSILIAKKDRGTSKEFDKWLNEFLIFKKQGKGPLDPQHMGLVEMFENKEEGLKILEEKIRLLEKSDNPFDPPDLTRNILADKYDSLGRYDDAITQYNKILNSSGARSGGNIESFKAARMGLFQLYKKINEPAKAYENIQKYITLQDSSYAAIEKKNIAEFEVKYNTQEKEKNILIQQAEIKDKTDKLKTSIIIITALLSLAFLAIIAIRIRNKFTRNMHLKEKELQLQKIKELEQNNKLLSLNSMLEGQEVERLRIAQDLHDGLGGLLTTVKAHFNTIEKEIDNIKNINLYEKTNKLIDEACIEVRRIAHDMVPHSIKISGLRGALEDLKNSISTRGLECEIDIHGQKLDHLPAEKASMIYRIIQETTNNAVKHAKANKLFIQLLEHENNLHITVEDDGQGFDINNILSKKGMGLKNIDSRINYLSGKINYDSSPNHGTTVNIEIPIN